MSIKELAGSRVNVMTGAVERCDCHADGRCRCCGRKLPLVAVVHHRDCRCESCDPPVPQDWRDAAEGYGQLVCLLGSVLCAVMCGFLLAAW